MRVLLAVFAWPAAGCGSERTFEPATTPETLTSRSVVTAYVTIPPPTTLPLDPALIEACVQRVQFGAFLGTEEYTLRWDAAGMDVAELRSDCESLARSDPDLVLRIAREWADIQSFMAAGSTTAPATAST